MLIVANANHLSLQLTRGVQKILQLDHKKNGNVTNCTLFFNIITTVFNAFATFFWQTVNSTKIEFLCLSLQPLLYSLLERFIVRIADTTKVRLQIAEQKISHWEPGQDCMQGGLTVRSRSHKQPAVQSWTCGLERCRAPARLLASAFLSVSP